MFKALCTFDHITPRFLDFIFGLGRKTKSFDEDYMACYHHFSIDEEAGSETIAENRDESYSQGGDRKLRAKSHGQCILVLLFKTAFLFSSVLISYTRMLSIYTADLCYNVRYFELHGRDLEDPWSCRQSAIHQKYYFTNGCSNWIIVQPPKLFSAALRDIEMDQIGCSMNLHIRYLAAAMANWRPYLNYMTEKLTELVGTSHL